MLHANAAASALRLPQAVTQLAGSTLLILGGSAFQIPAIQHAVRLGCRVITCDYLPDNPGHRHSHLYINASTTDRQAVLALAREHRVDGVLAYASDPAAPTAAYVSAQLQLSGCAPEAIATLTNKGLFRAFIQQHGFQTPRFNIANDAQAALAAAQAIGFPVMIKPIDSSGSKGVSRVDNVGEIPSAVRLAQQFSRSMTIIIEEWIEREGPQIAGDGLVVDGQLVFGGFGDEHFDCACSPHAPIGESYPGRLPSIRRALLFRELQRLFGLLGIRQLVFNLDAMFDRNGRLILIEIGSRAGGNALPQLIHRHTGVDLTGIAIQQALGVRVDAAQYQGTPQGFHASHILHSRTGGRFGGFRLAPSLQPYVLDLQLTAPLGCKVEPFTSAKDALGYALFQFPDAMTMQQSLERMSDCLQPIVQ